MTNGQRLMTTACVAEGLTGALLIIAPSVVAKLLLNADMDSPALIIANIAGIALVSLVIACWPLWRSGVQAPILGMLFYSLFAGLRLAEAGAVPDTSGSLLWPAVVIHLVLAVLFASVVLWSHNGWTSSK